MLLIKVPLRRVGLPCYTEEKSQKRTGEIGIVAETLLLAMLC